MASARVHTIVLLALVMLLGISHSAAANISTESLLAQGNCKDAIPDLEQSVATDHTHAPYYLALCRLRQEGHSASVSRLLQDAAAHGNHRAEYLLGLFKVDPRPEDAVSHFKIAADGGNLIAEHRLDNAPAASILRPASSESIVAAVKSNKIIPPATDIGHLIRYAIHAGEEGVAVTLLARYHPDLDTPSLGSLAVLAVARQMNGLANKIINRLAIEKHQLSTEDHSTLLMLAVRLKSAQIVSSLANTLLETDSRQADKEPGRRGDDAIAHAFDQAEPSILLALSLQDTVPAARRDYLESLVRTGTATSLLSLAAASGDRTMLDLLLRENSARLWIDDNGNSAAEKLYLHGHRDLLSNQLARSPIAPIPGQVFNRLLIAALAANDAALVERLVQLTETGGQEIHSSAQQKALFAPTDARHRLLELVDPKENKDAKGRSLLMQALRFRNLHMARQLLQMAASTSALTPDRNNRSLGWYAITYGDDEILRLTLGLDPALEQPDSVGFTPLHQSARLGQHDTLVTLLTMGADINAVSAEGNTALMLAATGFPPLVDTLIGQGADVRARNNGSNTALMISASQECLECARLLVAAGANPRRKNANGISAIEMTKNPGIRTLLQ